MSPSVAAAVWQKPARRSGRALKVACAMAVSLIAVDYVAGCLFLKSLHQDPRGATPLTLAQYGYYYGDRPEVRHRLLASGAVASIAVIAGLGACLLPRRRTLHGDARFATRGEIAAAGLLGHEGIIRPVRARVLASWCQTR
jgi:type IV secretion system protein VirD4